MDYTLKITLRILVTDSQTQSWFLPKSSCPNRWWVIFVGPCWPAGVAHIWLWWCVLTDSSAKAGILTALLLGLVSFSGTQIWSRPDLFDLLTGFLLRAAVLTLTHAHARTRTHARTHTHTHTHTCTQTDTHTWQTGKYFITPCNGRASGYCTLQEQQDYCEAPQVSAQWWMSFFFFFFYQHKCANNIRLDLRSRLQRETAETSIWMDSWGTEVNFGDSCSIQGLQSTLHHMEI